jgi:hypothetical protein
MIAVHVHIHACSGVVGRSEASTRGPSHIKHWVACCAVLMNVHLCMHHIIKVVNKMAFAVLRRTHGACPRVQIDCCFCCDSHPNTQCGLRSLCDCLRHTRVHCWHHHVEFLPGYIQIVRRWCLHVGNHERYRVRDTTRRPRLSACLGGT